MISNEKIAHDLTIIYLSNRYGVKVPEDFTITDGNSHGRIKTEHFPDMDVPKYKTVGTGEKGFLGFEKTVKVQDGYETDELFIEILKNYRAAYDHFLALLENEQ